MLSALVNEFETVAVRVENVGGIAPRLPFGHEAHMHSPTIRFTLSQAVRDDAGGSGGSVCTRQGA